MQTENGIFIAILKTMVDAVFHNVRPNINDVNKWWRKRRKSVACQTWNLRDEMLPSSRLNHLVVWFFHIHSTGSMRKYLAFLSNCLEFQYQLKLRLNLLGRRLLLIDVFFFLLSFSVSLDFFLHRIVFPFSILPQNNWLNLLP